jgi:hypothetical protein
MFTQTLKLIATACAILISTASYAQDFHPELPIESMDVTVTHAKAGGFILVRPCQSCAMMSLQLDANSKAFTKGKAVSLSSIPEHPSSAITVIYDPQTKIVKRVFW